MADTPQTASKSKPPLLNRLLTTLCWLVAICALLVTLGSCEFRTGRSFTDGSSMREGAGEWAALTFLLGGLVIATLFCWLWVQESWRFFAPIAVMLLAAAVIAGDHRRDLRAETSYYDLVRGRDYELTIAVGLPFVTITGALGALLALLTVALWVLLERRTLPEGTDGPAP